MKDPAALIYTDKWIAATQGMRGHEKGWYFELILYQFDKGPIPNDMDEIASICRIRPSEYNLFEQVFEQVLKQKFEQNDEGKLENQFAKEIITKRERFKEKRSKSGKLSYVIRFAKKHLKVTDKEIETIKSNFEVDSIDIKDSQELEQSLNKCLNKCSNKKVNTLNEDVNVNNNSSGNIDLSNSNISKILLSELFSSDDSDKKNLNPNYEIPERDKEASKIAYRFWSLIRANHEHHGISTVKIDKANYKQWVPPIRLMLQNKEVTLEQLREIHDFLKRDIFWQKNILSTSKLREQAQKLLMAIKTRKHEGNRQGSQSSDEQKRRIDQKKSYKGSFDT